MSALASAVLWKPGSLDTYSSLDRIKKSDWWGLSPHASQHPGSSPWGLCESGREQGKVGLESRCR